MQSLLCKRVGNVVGCSSFVHYWDIQPPFPGSSNEVQMEVHIPWPSALTCAPSHCIGGVRLKNDTSVFCALGSQWDWDCSMDCKYLRTIDLHDRNRGWEKTHEFSTMVSQNTSYGWTGGLRVEGGVYIPFDDIHTRGRPYDMHLLGAMGCRWWLIFILSDALGAGQN